MRSCTTQSPLPCPLSPSGIITLWETLASIDSIISFLLASSPSSSPYNYYEIQWCALNRVIRIELYKLMACTCDQTRLGDGRPNLTMLGQIVITTKPSYLYVAPICVYLCLKVHVEDAVSFIHHKVAERAKIETFSVLKMIH